MKGTISTPRVEPIAQRDWHSKQSRYPSLPEAGISNRLLVAPSFTGKTWQDRVAQLVDPGLV